jgi:hypothetical protein
MGGFFSNFPVEVRLLFTIVMNAVIFIAMKKGMQKFANVLNVPPPQSTAPPKNKMKGPNLNDLKKTE